MAATAEATGASFQELTSSIETDRVSCLNERPGNTVRNLFVADPGVVLKSDDDDQLLISLPFTGDVHLRYIEIECPPGEIPPRSERVLVWPIVRSAQSTAPR
jgi:hypothetical protein